MAQMEGNRMNMVLAPKPNREAQKPKPAVVPAPKDKPESGKDEKPAKPAEAAKDAAADAAP
jgi:hypothetical protein